MVLASVTPLGPNFIKDWPAQNAINCDALDAFAGPCLTTHSLTAYTPQVIGVTTSPVVGTGGFTRGYYYRIFDLVYVWGEFRFGTAAINIGSGAWTFTLPFDADSVLPASTSSGNGATLGNALIWNDAVPANTQTATAQLSTVNTVQFNVRMASGGASRVVGSAVPITWAINDGILWNARFKRAG